MRRVADYPPRAWAYAAAAADALRVQGAWLTGARQRSRDDMTRSTIDG
jgi:hypothetical protein